MQYIYQEWDGSSFPSTEHLELFANFLEFVLEYGDDALRALRRLESDPEQAKILEQWIRDGLLEKVGARFRLTPRAISNMQRRALMEIFRNLKPDSSEGHETKQQGVGGERLEATRAYRWGDSLTEIDRHTTLLNAARRSGGKLPIQLHEDDFETHLAESNATCSTVILLDMSGSMTRWNRFVQAKKCAMAVFALIRQRFALDTVDVVGFASGAEIVPEHKLPLLIPKKISTYEPHIRLCTPITDLSEAPQHFTNLQLGLQTARQILARRGGTNRQVFIITDGQPTAYVEGANVHLVYPPDEATAISTLSEAVLLSKQGIRFSTFALIEDYFYMDWVSFVDQLTKLTRGVAFYCTSENLSQCVMESYLSGRKSRAFLA